MVVGGGGGEGVMFFFCGETTKTENREQLGKKRLGIGWGWGR